MFCTHREYITHLEADNAWLRERLDLERRRAEMAIDQLLNIKLGVVTPLTQPIPLSPAEREAEQEIQRLTRDPEFASPSI